MFKLISKFSALFISIIIDFIEKIVFFPRLKKIISNAQPIDLIFDIGSNRGQSVKFFSKLFPEANIISFEPNEKLNKYYKNFNKSKYRIYNLGLSDICGNKIFYESILNETSSFSKPNLKSKWGKIKQILLLSNKNKLYKETRKAVITLDEFCRQESIHQIDYLKIDVEGHEFNVLLGATGLLSRGQIRYIQLENQKNKLHDSKFDKILRLLSEYKFKNIAEIKHGFGGVSDVLFYKSQN